MDIVLEIVDTLLLDRIYSTLFPASPSEYISQKFNNITSSTFSSVREGASPTPQYKYIFEPASQILNLEPTHWAYSSSLPRDNIYRQGVSLFLIVWYVSQLPPRRVLRASFRISVSNQSPGYSVLSFTSSAPDSPTFSSLTRTLSSTRSFSRIRSAWKSLKP